MPTYIRKKTYNTVIQKLNMASKFPQFKSIKQKNGYDFVGVLKPNITEYKIKIVYRGNLHPHITVLNPELQPCKHRYSDGSLCIYNQSEILWKKEMLVSDFIVPLTAMWLHFYEIFIECGEWLGPEAPHSDPSDKNITDNRIPI